MCPFVCQVYHEDRIPIRLHHAPQLLLPHLLPSAVAPTSCLVLGTYFRFIHVAPGQGLFAGLISGKAFDFAWRREGMLKADETKPGVSSKSSSVSQCANGGSDNGAPSAECKEEISSYTAPPWLYDTLEIACTSRGLGWQFGADLYIPNDPRPSERAVGFGPLSTILNGRGYLILWVSESSHMMWFVTYSARPTSNMEESFFWS
ncbi:hypothetical protein V8E55_006168 [Tylopilus felleus]